MRVGGFTSALDLYYLPASLVIAVRSIEIWLMGCQQHDRPVGVVSWAMLGIGGNLYCDVVQCLPRRPLCMSDQFEVVFVSCVCTRHQSALIWLIRFEVQPPVGRSKWLASVCKVVVSARMDRKISDLLKQQFAPGYCTCWFMLEL